MLGNLMDEGRNGAQPEPAQEGAAANPTILPKIIRAWLLVQAHDIALVAEEMGITAGKLRNIIRNPDAPLSSNTLVRLFRWSIGPAAYAQVRHFLVYDCKDADIKLPERAKPVQAVNKDALNAEEIAAVRRLLSEFGVKSP